MAYSYHLGIQVLYVYSIDFPLDCLLSLCVAAVPVVTDGSIILSYFSFSFFSFRLFTILAVVELLAPFSCLMSEKVFFFFSFSPNT